MTATWYNLAGIPGIMQAGDRLLGEAVTLIQFSQQQAAGIGGYPAALKIGDDFLGKKTFTGEPVMADCVQRVSRLRSCLLSDYRILVDTLSYFMNFL